MGHKDSAARRRIFIRAIAVALKRTDASWATIDAIATVIGEFYSGGRGDNRVDVNEFVLDAMSGGTLNQLIAEKRLRPSDSDSTGEST
jgi:hypothetical protein